MGPKEEGARLSACQSSRSRSLYAAVVLALNTCMRYSELRLLKWRQVDFGTRTIAVEASKTEAGVLSLNDRALAVLKFWADLFPDREKDHYVFPFEKYGLAQRKDEHKGLTQACVHSTESHEADRFWKEAWETAKKTAGVSCRFHDLRHKGCTRYARRWHSVLRCCIDYGMGREYHRKDVKAISPHWRDCATACSRSALGWDF